MKRGLPHCWKLIIFITMLSCTLMESLQGQEQGPTDPTRADTAPEEENSDSEKLSPEEQILEMDIRTSSFTELAAWCRSLGLSEGGTKEDLADRLRNYFNFSKISESEETKKQKIITIESARSTEYFTLDVVDEEYARLRGDVIISLKDGDAIHRIMAGEILYNRTRNSMTASGGVEYLKEEGDTVETFKGESITVNLDNWSSIFLDGITEHSLSGEETTYRFAGTVISRSDEEVTVLTKATISNAKNKEAFWSLHANKLWLLPGSDWAIASAILKVGEIPLLYIPFFYFPADEIIFHPVIGYRSREGNFFQTTTYILGRPKANPASQSSISKILGSSENMEKKREGIFLRSTGKKSRDPNDTRLSVLFDAYANLGSYMGTELSLPKRNLLGGLELSAGIGFTRDVYQVGTGYTPFDVFAQYDGSDTWNNSYFFSQELPFRYRLNTNGSLAIKDGTFTWLFPLYSDRYVNEDFLKRSEEMDWIQLLKGTTLDDTTGSNTLTLGEHEWRLNGSYTPTINQTTSKVAPYITSFSISSISNSLAFKYRQSTQVLSLATGKFSPNRDFFFPDKLTIYSISASIAGTPFSVGNTKTAETSKTEEEQKEDPFKGIGTPRAPWETGTASETSTTETNRLDHLMPPVLTQRFELPKSGGPRFAIDYRLTPSSASELQFRSSQQNWPETEDINWSEVSSLLSTVRGDGYIGFTLHHLSKPEEGLYTSILRFVGNGAWQDYSYINDEAEEYSTNGALDQNKIDSAHARAYNATFFTTSYDFTTTIKPLYQNAIWGNSNFQYILKGLIAKSVFKGTGADPSWDVQVGEWIKEDLETHQVAANLAASVMDKTQNVSITADIPPKDTTLGTNATFRVWLTETNIRGKILDPWEKVIFDPFYFTEIIRIGTKYPFEARQEVVYHPELEEFTSLTSKLSWIGFSASYTAARSRTYTLDENLGWIQSTEDEKLNPRELRFDYIHSFKKENLWKKRLSFTVNVNTGLSFDLQRYTYSKFTFSLGFTISVTNFVDFSFSTTSENAVIFRYFHDLPFFDDIPDDRIPPGEQNLFIDLLNSFRFDDDELRRNSGFKLKSFKLNLTHHLGDWNAVLGVTLSPYLDQTIRPYQYKFNQEISFLVQWVPISEIKSEVTYSKDKMVFK